MATVMRSVKLKERGLSWEMSLWACPWGIILTVLIDKGRLIFIVGWTISGAGAFISVGKKAQQMHACIHCPP